MNEQADSKKDFTKKDLMKILEKMDSERTKQSSKRYSVTKSESDPMFDDSEPTAEEFRENL